MDLVQELDRITEEGKKDNTVGLTRATCRQIDRVLCQFLQQPGLDFQASIRSLRVTLNALTTLAPHLVVCEPLHELCHQLFLVCAAHILGVDWQRQANGIEEERIKIEFRAALGECFEAMQASGMSHWFLMLQFLMINHWTHPVLASMMLGKDLDEFRALQYLGRGEYPDLLKLRVQMLTEGGCDDLALNLCNWCVRHPQFSDDLFMRLKQLSLLEKQGKQREFFSQCLQMRCCTGLPVLQHVVNKRSYNPNMQLAMSRLFLFEDWYRPSSFCCTKEFLKIWLRMEWKVERSRRKMSENLLKVASMYTCSWQLITLVDIIRQQFGSYFLQVCCEILLKALKIDTKGFLNARKKYKHSDAAFHKSRLNYTCHVLSCLFRNHTLKMRQIAMVTALSLEPSKELFYLVEQLYQIDPAKHDVNQNDLHTDESSSSEDERLAIDDDAEILSSSDDDTTGTSSENSLLKSPASASTDSDRVCAPAETKKSTDSDPLKVNPSPQPMQCENNDSIQKTSEVMPYTEALNEIKCMIGTDQQARDDVNKSQQVELPQSDKSDDSKAHLGTVSQVDSDVVMQEVTSNVEVSKCETVNKNESISMDTTVSDQTEQTKTDSVDEPKTDLTESENAGDCSSNQSETDSPDSVEVNKSSGENLSPTENVGENDTQFAESSQNINGDSVKIDSPLCQNQETVQSVTDKSDIVTEDNSNPVSSDIDVTGVSEISSVTMATSSVLSNSSSTDSSADSSVNDVQTKSGCVKCSLRKSDCDCKSSASSSVESDRISTSDADNINGPQNNGLSSSSNEDSKMSGAMRSVSLDQKTDVENVSNTDSADCDTIAANIKRKRRYSAGDLRNMSPVVKLTNLFHGSPPPSTYSVTTDKSGRLTRRASLDKQRRKSENTNTLKDFTSKSAGGEMKNMETSAAEQRKPVKVISPGVQSLLQHRFRMNMNEPQKDCASPNLASNSLEEKLLRKHANRSSVPTTPYEKFFQEWMARKTKANPQAQMNIARFRNSQPSVCITKLTGNLSESKTYSTTEVEAVDHARKVQHKKENNLPEKSDHLNKKVDSKDDTDTKLLIEKMDQSNKKLASNENAESKTLNEIKESVNAETVELKEDVEIKENNANEKVEIIVDTKLCDETKTENSKNTNESTETISAKSVSSGNVIIKSSNGDISCKPEENVEKCAKTNVILSEKNEDKIEVKKENGDGPLLPNSSTNTKTEKTYTDSFLSFIKQTLDQDIKELSDDPDSVKETNEPKAESITAVETQPDIKPVMTEPEPNTVEKTSAEDVRQFPPAEFTKSFEEFLKQRSEIKGAAPSSETSSNVNTGQLSSESDKQNEAAGSTSHKKRKRSRSRTKESSKKRKGKKRKSKRDKSRDKSRSPSKSRKHKHKKSKKKSPKSSKLKGIKKKLRTDKEKTAANYDLSYLLDLSESVSCDSDADSEWTPSRLDVDKKHINVSKKPDMATAKESSKSSKHRRDGSSMKKQSSSSEKTQSSKSHSEDTVMSNSDTDFYTDTEAKDKSDKDKNVPKSDKSSTNTAQSKNTEDVSKTSLDKKDTVHHSSEKHVGDKLSSIREKIRRKKLKSIEKKMKHKLSSKDKSSKLIHKHKKKHRLSMENDPRRTSLKTSPKEGVRKRGRPFKYKPMGAASGANSNASIKVSTASTVKNKPIFIERQMKTRRQTRMEIPDRDHRFKIEIPEVKTDTVMEINRLLSSVRDKLLDPCQEWPLLRYMCVDRMQRAGLYYDSVYDCFLEKCCTYTDVCEVIVVGEDRSHGWTPAKMKTQTQASPPQIPDVQRKQVLPSSAPATKVLVKPTITATSPARKTVTVQTQTMASRTPNREWMLKAKSIFASRPASGQKTGLPPTNKSLTLTNAKPACGRQLNMQSKPVGLQLPMSENAQRMKTMSMTGPPPVNRVSVMDMQKPAINVHRSAPSQTVAQLHESSAALMLHSQITSSLSAAQNSVTNSVALAQTTLASRVLVSNSIPTQQIVNSSNSAMVSTGISKSTGINVPLAQMLTTSHSQTNSINELAAMIGRQMTPEEARERIAMIARQAAQNTGSKMLSDTKHLHFISARQSTTIPSVSVQPSLPITAQSTASVATMSGSTLLQIAKNTAAVKSAANMARQTPQQRPGNPIVARQIQPRLATNQQAYFVPASQGVRLQQQPVSVNTAVMQMTSNQLVRGTLTGTQSLNQHQSTQAVKPLQEKPMLAARSNAANVMQMSVRQPTSSAALPRAQLQMNKSGTPTLQMKVLPPKSQIQSQVQGQNVSIQSQQGEPSVGSKLVYTQYVMLPSGQQIQIPAGIKMQGQTAQPTGQQKSVVQTAQPTGQQKSLVQTAQPTGPQKPVVLSKVRPIRPMIRLPDGQQAVIAITTTSQQLIANRPQGIQALTSAPMNSAAVSAISAQQQQQIVTSAMRMPQTVPNTQRGVTSVMSAASSQNTQTGVPQTQQPISSQSTSTTDVLTTMILKKILYDKAAAAAAVAKTSPASESSTSSSATNSQHSSAHMLLQHLANAAMYQQPMPVNTQQAAKTTSDPASNKTKTQQGDIVKTADSSKAATTRQATPQQGNSSQLLRALAAQSHSQREVSNALQQILTKMPPNASVSTAAPTATAAQSEGSAQAQPDAVTADAEEIAHDQEAPVQEGNVVDVSRGACINTEKSENVDVEHDHNVEDPQPAVHCQISDSLTEQHTSGINVLCENRLSHESIDGGKSLIQSEDIISNNKGTQNVDVITPCVMNPNDNTPATCDMVNLGTSSDESLQCADSDKLQQQVMRLTSPPSTSDLLTSADQPSVQNNATITSDGTDSIAVNTAAYSQYVPEVTSDNDGVALDLTTSSQTSNQNPCGESVVAMDKPENVNSEKYVANSDMGSTAAAEVSTTDTLKAQSAGQDATMNTSSANADVADSSLSLTSTPEIDGSSLELNTEWDDSGNNSKVDDSAVRQLFAADDEDSSSSFYGWDNGVPKNSPPPDGVFMHSPDKDGQTTPDNKHDVSVDTDIVFHVDSSFSHSVLNISPSYERQSTNEHSESCEDPASLTTTDSMDKATNTDENWSDIEHDENDNEGSKRFYHAETGEVIPLLDCQQCGYGECVCHLINADVDPSSVDLFEDQEVDAGQTETGDHLMSTVKTALKQAGTSRKCVTLNLPPGVVSEQLPVEGLKVMMVPQSKVNQVVENLMKDPTESAATQTSRDDTAVYQDGEQKPAKRWGLQRVQGTCLRFTPVKKESKNYSFANRCSPVASLSDPEGRRSRNDNAVSKTDEKPGQVFKSRSTKKKEAQSVSDKSSSNEPPKKKPFHFKPHRFVGLKKYDIRHCKKCNMSFSTKDALIHHRQTECPGGAEPSSHKKLSKEESVSQKVPQSTASIDLSDSDKVISKPTLPVKKEGTGSGLKSKYTHSCHLCCRVFVYRASLEEHIANHDDEYCDEPYVEPKVKSKKPLKRLQNSCSVVKKLHKKSKIVKSTKDIERAALDKNSKRIMKRSKRLQAKKDAMALMSSEKKKKIKGTKKSKKHPSKEKKIKKKHSRSHSERKIYPKRHKLRRASGSTVNKDEDSDSEDDDNQPADNNLDQKARDAALDSDVKDANEKENATLSNKQTSQSAPEISSLKTTSPDEQKTTEESADDKLSDLPNKPEAPKGDTLMSESESVSSDNSSRSQQSSSNKGARKFDSRSWMCYICQKEMFSQKSLRRHLMATHKLRLRCALMASGTTANWAVDASPRKGLSPRKKTLPTRLQGFNLQGNRKNMAIRRLNNSLRSKMSEGKSLNDSVRTEEVKMEAETKEDVKMENEPASSDSDSDVSSVKQEEPNAEFSKSSSPVMTTAAETKPALPQRNTRSNSTPTPVVSSAPVQEPPAKVRRTSTTSNGQAESTPLKTENEGKKSQVKSESSSSKKTKKEEGKKKWHCNICGIELSRRDSVNRHKKTVHKNLLKYMKLEESDAIDGDLCDISPIKASASDVSPPALPLPDASPATCHKPVVRQIIPQSPDKQPVSAIHLEESTAEDQVMVSLPEQVQRPVAPSVSTVCPDATPVSMTTSAVLPQQTASNSKTKATKEKNIVVKCFKCEECEAAYTRNSSLQKHRKTAHNLEKELNANGWECYICHSKFGSHTQLIVHFREEHASSREDSSFSLMSPEASPQKEAAASAKTPPQKTYQQTGATLSTIDPVEFSSFVQSPSSGNLHGNEMVNQSSAQNQLPAVPKTYQNIRADSHRQNLSANPPQAEKQLTESQIVAIVNEVKSPKKSIPKSPKQSQPSTPKKEDGEAASKKSPRSKKDLTCDICDRVFTQEYNLKRHKRTVHKMDIAKSAKKSEKAAHNNSNRQSPSAGNTAPKRSSERLSSPKTVLNSAKSPQTRHQSSSLRSPPPRKGSVTSRKRKDAIPLNGDMNSVTEADTVTDITKTGDIMDIYNPNLSLEEEMDVIQSFLKDCRIPFVEQNNSTPNFNGGFSSFDRFYPMENGDDEQVQTLSAGLQYAEMGGFPQLTEGAVSDGSGLLVAQSHQNVAGLALLKKPVGLASISMTNNARVLADVTKEMAQEAPVTVSQQGSVQSRPSAFRPVKKTTKSLSALPAANNPVNLVAPQEGSTSTPMITNCTGLGTPEVLPLLMSAVTGVVGISGSFTIEPAGESEANVANNWPTESHVNLEQRSQEGSVIPGVPHTEMIKLSETVQDLSKTAMSSAGYLSYPAVPGIDQQNVATVSLQKPNLATTNGVSMPAHSDGSVIQMTEPAFSDSSVIHITGPGVPANTVLQMTNQNTLQLPMPSMLQLSPAAATALPVTDSRSADMASVSVQATEPDAEVMEIMQSNPAASDMMSIAIQTSGPDLNDDDLDEQASTTNDGYDDNLREGATLPTNNILVSQSEPSDTCASETLATSLQSNAFTAINKLYNDIMAAEGGNANANTHGFPQLLWQQQQVDMTSLNGTNAAITSNGLIENTEENVQRENNENEAEPGVIPLQSTHPESNQFVNSLQSLVLANSSTGEGLLLSNGSQPVTMVTNPASGQQTQTAESSELNQLIQNVEEMNTAQLVDSLTQLQSLESLMDVQRMGYWTNLLTETQPYMLAAGPEAGANEAAIMAMSAVNQGQTQNPDITTDIMANITGDITAADITSQAMAAAGVPLGEPTKMKKSAKKKEKPKEKSDRPLKPKPSKSKKKSASDVNAVPSDVVPSALVSHVSGVQQNGIVEPANTEVVSSHKKTSKPKNNSPAKEDSELTSPKKQSSRTGSHQCDICGLSLCSAYNVRRHKKSQHKITEIPPKTQRKLELAQAEITNTPLTNHDTVSVPIQPEPEQSTDALTQALTSSAVLSNTEPIHDELTEPCTEFTNLEPVVLPSSVHHTHDNGINHNVSSGAVSGNLMMTTDGAAVENLSEMTPLMAYQPGNSSLNEVYFCNSYNNATTAMPYMCENISGNYDANSLVSATDPGTLLYIGQPTAASVNQFMQGGASVDPHQNYSSVRDDMPAGLLSTQHSQSYQPGAHQVKDSPFDLHNSSIAGSYTSEASSSASSKSLKRQKKRKNLTGVDSVPKSKKKSHVKGSPISPDSSSR